MSNPVKWTSIQLSGQIYTGNKNKNTYIEREREAETRPMSGPSPNPTHACDLMCAQCSEVFTIVVQLLGGKAEKNGRMGSTRRGRF